MRQEEFYDHTVMSFHETMKAIPLGGKAYKWIMYFTGAEREPQQTWETQTQRTRGYGLQSPTQTSPYTSASSYRGGGSRGLAVGEGSV